MRFHHIGYAVVDIDRFAGDFFQPTFQPLSISDKIFDPLQEVTVCFAEMQGGVVIELVQPANPNSRLYSIINSNRGGFYHVCYEVENLDREIDRFRRQRCMPLGRPVPAVAFGKRRIAFLLTPHRDLIELLERA
jgi:methylmalonyl-CoA/ethylmalonyl-CoA epimerase